MNSFADIPIAKKLVSIMLATTVIALLLATMMQAATEGMAYREDIVENLGTIADVIGTNSAAALTFDDSQLARNMLRSLKAEPSITDGQIFDADGQLLASYIANPAAADPQLVAEQQARVQGWIDTKKPVREFIGLKSVDIVQPIRFDRETIGYVHLRATLQPLVATLVRFVWMAGITVALAILVAYLLSFRLQALVSRPILMLADLMRRVTRDEDYTLRAEKTGNDEVGSLIDGFNNMLQQVSERDQRLKEGRATLDEQARSLAHANERLNNAMADSIAARDAAQQASRAKSEFLARMSHEIRTPMNGVLGMTELILASTLTDKQRHFAQTIRDSADSLLEIINDILDFSKIEAGKLELEQAEFDLRDVVESIVELLSVRAQDKGIEVLCDVAPSMNTYVRGDQTRLRQILTNLIGNAIKFTNDGEIIIRVRADRRKNGCYRFEVHDTGIGIRPESQEMIFELFSQEDGGTTRKYGGTGLGLAICKQLVELMGGEIGVESVLNEGTTFWFTAHLPEGSRDWQETTLSDLEDPASLRVLIVDDNCTNREILLHQLAAWEVRADSAASGPEALELMEAHAEAGSPYELAILDWHMPDMDGLDLAQAIHNQPLLNSTKMIMLTSATVDSESTRMLDAGVKAYINKPVRPARLRQLIAQVLEIHRTGAPSSKIPQKRLDDAGLPAVPAGGRVLLVEDNAVNREVATSMLHVLRCTVDEAINGRDAVELARRGHYDLILMDCEMPVMDGCAATNTIREWELDVPDHEHTPIVALTAHALPEDRKRCLSAGMDDFLSKPFSMNELRDILSRWLPMQQIDNDASPPDSVTDGHDVKAHGAVSTKALESIVALDPSPNHELANRVIGAYEHSSVELVDSLDSALTAGNGEQLRMAAHALKSSSGNVGADRLMNLCREVELATREDEDSCLAEHIAAIRLEHKLVLDELRKWSQR